MLSGREETVVALLFLNPDCEKRRPGFVRAFFFFEITGKALNLKKFENNKKCGK